MRFPRPIHIASALVLAAATAVVVSFIVIDGAPSASNGAPAARTTAQAQKTSLTKQVTLSGSIESSAVWDIGGDGSLVLRASAGTSTINAPGGASVAAIAVRIGQHVRRGQMLARMDDTAAQLKVEAAQQALDNATDARDDISSSGATTVTTSSGIGAVAGNGGAASQAAGSAASAVRQRAVRPRARAHAYAVPAAPTATVPGGAVPTTDAGGSAPVGGGSGTSTPASGTKPSSGTKPAGGGANGSGGARVGGQQPSATTKRQSTAALIATADAEVTTARSKLAAAKQALAATVLRAPAAGVVVAQRLTRGGTVPSGAAITVRSTGARVTLSVGESDVIGMSIGDAATVTVSALSASLTGRVAAIGAASGGAGRAASSIVTYPVIIVVDTPVTGLHDGMSTSVVITTAHVASALVVPKSAVHDTSAGAYVHVESSTGAIHKVRVKIGLTTDQGVQVTGGALKAGDTVRLKRTSTSASRQSSGFPAGFPAPPPGFGGPG